MIKIDIYMPPYECCPDHVRHLFAVGISLMEIYGIHGQPVYIVLTDSRVRTFSHATSVCMNACMCVGGRGSSVCVGGV